MTLRVPAERLRLSFTLLAQWGALARRELRRLFDDLMGCAWTFIA